jgi:hypothetical protein
MVYERQIATARRLITAKGQMCTWREPGVPGGTFAEPTAGTPADYQVPIVFLSNSNRESLAGLLSMIPGTEIPTQGMRGLMPAVPFAPSLAGRVTRGSTFSEPALHLLDKNGIDVLNLNGEIILYYLRFAG